MGDGRTWPSSLVEDGRTWPSLLTPARAQAADGTGRISRGLGGARRELHASLRAMRVRRMRGARRRLGARPGPGPGPTFFVEVKLKPRVGPTRTNSDSGRSVATAAARSLRLAVAVTVAVALPRQRRRRPRAPRRAGAALQCTAVR